MGKIKVDFIEYDTMREKLKSQEKEIYRLRCAEEKLTMALMFAAELIPKGKYPVGVGGDTFAWLINQSKKWRSKGGAEDGRNAD